MLKSGELSCTPVAAIERMEKPEIDVSAVDMTGNPLVTVIVTVFKRTEYLDQALLSALAQSFQSHEIIVTDDSCSSAVKAIVKSFGTSAIRYRCNPDTLGVALNLRLAIEEARGKYIAILNDDDLWEPDFLSELLVPLERDSSIGLAFSDHWVISLSGLLDLNSSDKNAARYGRSGLPRGLVADPASLVLEKNGVPLAMASLIRKDAVKLDLLVPKVAGAYDFWISCLLASSGTSFYYVPKRLTRYRIHAAMETARRAPDKNLNMVYIYGRLLELNAFPGKERFLAGKLAKALFQVAKDKVYFDNTREARAHLRRSMRVHPSLKALVMILCTFLPHRVRSALALSKRAGAERDPA